jgi:hypothetical protein
MPVTTFTNCHLYVVSIGAVMFQSAYYDGSSPSVALKNKDGSQGTYKIVVRTFQTAAQKKQYLSQNRLDNSNFNAVLYGREN